jgi:hypothetical protein
MVERKKERKKKEKKERVKKKQITKSINSPFTFLLHIFFLSFFLFLCFPFSSTMEAINQQFAKNFNKHRKVFTKDMAEALGFESVDFPDSKFPITQLSKFCGTLHFVPFQGHESNERKKEGCLIGFYPIHESPEKYVEDYDPDVTFTPWRKRVYVPEKERFFAKEVLDESRVTVMLMVTGVTVKFREHMGIEGFEINHGMDVGESAHMILTALNADHETNFLLQETTPLLSLPLDTVDSVNFSFAFPSTSYTSFGGMTFGCERTLFDGKTQLKRNEAALKHVYGHFFPVICLDEFVPELEKGEMIVNPKDGTKVVYPQLEECKDYPEELMALSAVVVQQKKGKKNYNVWISPYVKGNGEDNIAYLSVGKHCTTNKELEIRPEWIDVKLGYRIDAENCYDMRTGEEKGESEDEEGYF